MEATCTLLDNRYRVVSHITTTKNSAVYLVIDTRTNKPCAAKIGEMPLGLGKRDVVKAYQLESERLGLLNSKTSSVIQVQDFFLHHRAPVLVTEYAPHGTLANVFAQRFISKQ